MVVKGIGSRHWLRSDSGPTTLGHKPLDRLRSFSLFIYEIEMIVWEDYCEEWKRPYCLIIGLYWTQNKNLKFWVVVVAHGLAKADVWLGRICFKPCQCTLIVPCSVDIRILILILRGKIYLSFLFSFSFSGDQKFSRNPFQGYLEECAVIILIKSVWLERSL